MVSDGEIEETVNGIEHFEGQRLGADAERSRDSHRERLERSSHRGPHDERAGRGGVQPE